MSGSEASHTGLGLGWLCGSKTEANRFTFQVSGFVFGGKVVNVMLNEQIHLKAMDQNRYS